MIIDLDEVNSNPFQNKIFDVCICGGGVAGITLALNLSNKLNIALLEAGGLDYSEKSQEFYKGNIIGLKYADPYECRLRYFGGTSNIWAGWCRPLDYHDFKPKKYLKHSGWPINRSDLDPYLEKAKAILDIPDKNTSPEDRFMQLLNKSKSFEEIEFWFSKPTRFGDKYREAIKSANNISCYINANVTDIILSKDLSRVKKIKVQNYKEKSYMANVKTFILAAGGMENPRIMLNCNHQIKEGLGNSTGLVGRFFAEHLHFTAGGFITEDQFKKKAREETYMSPFESFIRDNNILNFSFRIIRLKQHPKGFDLSYRQKLRRILCSWSPDIVKQISSRNCDFKQPDVDGRLRIISEQAPNYLSRIILSGEKDKFAMRRLAIDWRMAEIDKKTIKQGVMHFAKEFANMDLGRLRIVQWLLSEQPEFPGFDDDEWVGYHHMCTTKMGSSPKDGVVDLNQKVFGIDNFYVAGSSVFSTGGHANPTFTIVQMSLRLADHLNKKH